MMRSFQRFFGSAPTQTPYCPYPSGCFPGQLGTMPRDFSGGGGIAPELVGTQSIAFASLLTQGVADVAWPNGRVMSIGANGMVVSPSGTGKSLVFNWYMQPIEKYLARRAAVDASIRCCGLLLEDANREALLQSLSQWPVAGLMTDEAGSVGRLKGSPTAIKLLEGAALRHARLSTGRVALHGHRLTMLLLEQPEVFQATKHRLGAARGGIGFINRFFVAQLADSTRGGFYHAAGLSGEAAQAYERRVGELLDATVNHVEQGTQERPVIRLSAQATRLFIELSEAASANCKSGSSWYSISEYMSRHAERVLRLAGVFHVFEHGAHGEISLDTLERAKCLADWYVESFARMFYEPPKRTQAETDADELEKALLQTYWATGNYAFRQSEVRTYATNLGLTTSRFTRAQAEMCKQGRAQIVLHGRVPYIILNTFRLPSF